MSEKPLVLWYPLDVFPNPHIHNLGKYQGDTTVRDITEPIEGAPHVELVNRHSFVTDAKV